jgi:hypothetical protein
MESDLSVAVHGIRFKNPLVVAPATPTDGARYLQKCFASLATLIPSPKKITAPVLARRAPRAQSRLRHGTLADSSVDGEMRR